MITKIYNKKKLYALIVKNKYRKKGELVFFSSNDLPQQFGYINQKNHIIYPHKHNKRSTKISITSEVLIILNGILRVDFYDLKKIFIK